jgi:Icc-related predicted phosphoesterase
VQYLVASDLHYALPQLDWIARQAADFDAVVLAGDHLDVAGAADLTAQIAMFLALFGRLADRTTIVASSGNHDLDARRPDGEKAATWLTSVDGRVAVDGASVRVGADLVSVCTWWEGPVTRAEMEAQLERDADARAAAADDGGLWIWVHHAPPDSSPTSWSGQRHYGDEVLDALIARHRPDVVLAGHVHEAPFRERGAWHDRIGATLVLNAGRQPGPVPAHLLLDSATREVTWWSSDGEHTIRF